jgi:hypothetical protein
LILDRAIDVRQQLGVNRIQTELEDIKKFENMLHDKIQELEIELEDSSTAREKEILVNQTDTLYCVLDHLFNLKPGSDEIRTIITIRKKQIILTIKLLSIQILDIILSLPING